MREFKKDVSDGVYKTLNSDTDVIPQLQSMYQQEEKKVDMSSLMASVAQKVVPLLREQKLQLQELLIARVGKTSTVIAYVMVLYMSSTVLWRNLLLLTKRSQKLTTQVCELWLRMHFPMH